MHPASHLWIHVLSLAWILTPDTSRAQPPSRAACERACAAANEQVGEFRREGNDARCVCECKAGWARPSPGARCVRDSGPAATAPRDGPVVVRTQVPGAIDLPQVNWDCYCSPRFVTRPNKQTHLELLRTPEQQAAYEALKAKDAAMSALTPAREKFAKAAPPEAAIELAIIEHVLIKLGTAGFGATATAARIKDVVKYKEEIGHALHLLKEGMALRSVAKHLFEYYQAKESVRIAGENAERKLDEWWIANERAKNVPQLDHILGRPFTLTFTTRVGENVTIVRRSTDGVTRGITPIKDVPIEGSWDGR